MEGSKKVCMERVAFEFSFEEQIGHRCIGRHIDYINNCNGVKGKFYFSFPEYRMNSTKSFLIVCSHVEKGEEFKHY